mmetsp:Transcript_14099/g.28940  ORF Transcript_14099/g.28940 Transcript_14099/m.28940 type:complete len:226 (-) Transcript_14099:1426-2103(-)
MFRVEFLELRFVVLSLTLKFSLHGVQFLLIIAQLSLNLALLFALLREFFLEPFHLLLERLTLKLLHSQLCKNLLLLHLGLLSFQNVPLTVLKLPVSLPLLLLQRPNIFLPPLHLFPKLRNLPLILAGPRLSFGLFDSQALHCDLQLLLQLLNLALVSLFILHTLVLQVLQLLLPLRHQVLPDLPYLVLALLHNLVHCLGDSLALLVVNPHNFPLKFLLVLPPNYL